MCARQIAHPSTARRVILLVEEESLADLLRETLEEAGHACRIAASENDQFLDDKSIFDAAIVDLDTRARRGRSILATLRQARPELFLIALLPCGGLDRSGAKIECDLALEKPARLARLLRAIDEAPRKTP
jgi:DNA-binding response OmpR family regulator